MKRDFPIDSIESCRSIIGTQLASVIGETIESTWVAWDISDDSFFPDEPIILRIGSRNFEFVHNEMNELSATIDQIDLDMAPNFWGYTEFSLGWRKNALPELSYLSGKKLSSIELIEPLFESEVVEDNNDVARTGEKSDIWLFNGIAFTAEGKTVLIFNALDENGVCFSNYAKTDRIRLVSL